MGVGEVWEKAREVMTVERVFGPPIEKDGLTLIPVAAVRGGGGGGGGTGTSPEGEAGEGFGGGFGMSARPVGAFVIRDGGVDWEEATDTAGMVFGWQVVALASVFALRSMYKHRSRVKRRRRS